MLSFLRKTKPAPPNTDEAYNLAENLLGMCGRVTFHGLENCVYNANVCTDAGKIWFGDLVLNDKRKEDLQNLANKLDRTIYVLREHDGRWDNEKKPLLEKAIYTVQPA